MVALSLDSSFSGADSRAVTVPLGNETKRKTKTAPMLIFIVQTKGPLGATGSMAALVPVTGALDVRPIMARLCLMQSWLRDRFFE